ncbi:type II secretion system protein [Pseudoalteromonas sp. BZK2]|uniref:pilus assembly FimT family protein n=1 Tax=Pseudoalteromonas sp. BZK2 TaxID=1904458 RepID=UPI001654A9B3|nr:type II secretion system protein [Pseudoalteromonas sp. BZK2]MBC7007115.1 type II secretion system protein [Pseudoalteromonas sp. BZK2]
MVKKQSGLSLIELMIVITIIGFLVLVVVPFTQSWIYEAQVNNARSLLANGYSQAKALALRNPQNSQGDLASSACVKLADGVLQVREPEGSLCSGNIVWQGDWPEGVSLLRSNNRLTVFFINNRGLILKNDLQVGDNLTFTLNKGAVSYNGAFY